MIAADVAVDVAGYVLAGGESSRMQRSDLPQDKALLTLCGETLLERALAVVAAVCPVPHVLCGSAARCARLQHFAPTVPDQVPLAGPLGGLHAALLDAQARGAGWALLIPVDLPWMSSAVLGAFLHHALASGAAVAYMRASDTLQPLPVLVRVNTAPALGTILQSGERKLRDGLQAIALQAMTQRSGDPGLCLVALESLGLPAGSIEGCFRNVNTPEDFEQLQLDETLGSGPHQNKHGG